jgi:DNA-binding transcriptional LysR family regulator
MDLELRHSRIVVKIAESGSISKAAIQLNLPQPSLTAQLRRIEKSVGGDLFIRSRTGVSPTPLGDRIIPMMADLVQRADAMLGEAAAYTPRTLRFGNTEWTPPSLRGALQASMPSIEVQTQTLSPAAAVEAVQRGALIAAMIPCSAFCPDSDDTQSGLATMTIFREPIWLAVPQGHTLAGRDSVDSSHLGGLQWVRHSRDHWFHDIEKHLFAKLRLQDPTALHYVDGHHEAMNWVRDGDSAALTPPTGATRDVSLVPISETGSTEMTLVWRRGAVPRNTLRKLVEGVREYYCEYARTIPGYWPWIMENPSLFTELRRFIPA